MNKIAERTLKEINRDRRRFLDMLGKVGVSPAILKASSLAGGLMASRFAEAQQARKMIMIYHPNGSPNGRYLNGVAIRPFAPFGNTVATLEMTISNPGGHGNIWQAAGAQSYNGSDAHASSINMQAAKVIGNVTPYRSIQLGVKSLAEAGIDRLNGAAVTRINSPQTAFQQFFNGAPPPPAGGTGPTVFDRRRSVLDANKQGLSALRNKLGAEEQQRLDAHLSALATLENRINQEEMRAEVPPPVTGGGSCASPSLTAGATPLQEYKAQGDIAVNALACGLTNVVSIQFNETQASWLPNDGTADGVAFNADHHQANHGNGANYLPAIIEYMNKGVAHIISRLQATGIYNQTVVVVVSEMGDGQDHSAANGPITIATGIPGLRGGARNLGSNHYGVFPDVFKLMGLESSIGGMIHNYGPGGIVT
jgi:Protein of unknown function (DUF1552)